MFNRHLLVYSVGITAEGILIQVRNRNTGTGIAGATFMYREDSKRHNHKKITKKSA